METESLDLMTDIGELIKIEYPTDYTGDVFETLNNAMKRRDRWSVMQHDGCSATYMGICLDSINMGRIIGFL